MVECTFRTVCICFSAFISADGYASLSPSSLPHPARREGGRERGRGSERQEEEEEEGKRLERSSVFL